MKCRRGFTLVEIVLVIAIILILASVTALSVSDILRNSQRGQSSVSDAVTSAKSEISSKEAELRGYGF
jgi:prepilin-type N-terminal cleavage/methylation domain-containing protein